MFPRIFDQRSNRFLFLGDFNEVEIQNVLESFGFKGRKGDVKVQYCQPYSNIPQGRHGSENVGQSILELGYHCPFEYGDEQHFTHDCNEWFTWWICSL